MAKSNRRCETPATHSKIIISNATVQANFFLANWHTEQLDVPTTVSRVRRRYQGSH